LRKSPNKVRFLGIIQPFSDAIKLFNKELFIIKNLIIIYFIFVLLFYIL